MAFRWCGIESGSEFSSRVLANVVAPGAIALAIWWWVPRDPGLFVQAALTFLILVPLG